MKTFFVSFLVALAVIVILDGLWLGALARDFYRERLGQMLRDQPIWIAAILFYPVHAIGIAVFAVPLAINGGSWPYALLYGALFGFCVYAAYDLTNLATLRGWSTTLTLVDLAWGTTVTAVATIVAYLVVRH